LLLLGYAALSAVQKAHARMIVDLVEPGKATYKM